jgi:hypothetical protein
LLAERLEQAVRDPDRSRHVCRTNVSRSLTLSDLRRPTASDPTKYQLTDDGYNLAMHHNVEAMIEAHNEAHEKAYGEFMLRDPLSIPESLHWVGALIDTILELPTAEAMAQIKRYRSELDVLRSDV